ncbi:MAG: TraR/DksA family transcriptional regulator [Planctomycetes bacterium]|nr:TraR/DksA family transcriptional regulator [Planctomycetota bacterium]MBL7106230.1 TraR/DksA family transcriptional regulator [Phycisphaerae bacterium]
MVQKKTDSKKTASKTSKKKLSAKDRLEYFYQLLLTKRREILGSVSEIQGEAFKKSRLDASGDLSSMPIHMADMGSDTYQQELAVGLLDGERKILRQIDEAISRIADGSYGICLGTDKPIPKARLEAKPWAKYSVEYARKIELGQIKE